MVASANLYLKQNKTSHGDLSLKHICFSAEGFAKVYDHSAIHPLNNSFKKAFLKDHSVFLAEEQMQQLLRNNVKADFDVSSSARLKRLTCTPSACQFSPPPC